MKNVKQKIMIGALSTAIVVGLGFSMYLSFFNEKSVDKESTNGQEISNEGNNDSSQNSEPNEKLTKEDVILNPMNGVEDAVFSEGKKELSVNEIKNTENDVRRLYRDAKFEEGVELLNDLSEESIFTDEAKVLEQLRADGSLLANINGHIHEGEEGNGYAILNAFDGFQDTETLLLAVLNTEFKIREHVILYSGSLNPVADTEHPNISIMNKSKVDEIPIEITTVYESIKTLHHIHFSYDGNVLDAYILENNDGQLQFYTIEDLTNSTTYFTIEQWKKINSNIENNLPVMDGVLNMYSKYEINTVGEAVDTTEVEEVEEL